MIFQHKMTQTKQRLDSQVLEGNQWSDIKKRGHLDSIRQEVEVLRRLRGSLNVATLTDVYEDDTHVHIIMELCKGGELVHRIGSRHYSERTVSANLCLSRHAHRITESCLADH